MVSLNRLISGHTSLADSLFRHQIIKSPACECGDLNQSANHIFWQCPLFDKERTALLSSLRAIFNTNPLCIEQLLHIMNAKTIDALARFIDAVFIRIL
ncbi:unnamed protein product [Lasius platythorax]|uniref:Reverse transcriptase zinc-binding domain-containing protein n=1 Tax=Lasius platythorax TaxID=488582 RepID=A0AAV2NMR0_9HYME